MPTWPSGTKASATTTSATTNSISGARGDINQTITNQNAIIDVFNIPASPTNDHILVFNSTSGQFDVEANPGGELINDLTPSLGGNLDTNNFNIFNAGTTVFVNDDLDVVDEVRAWQTTNRSAGADAVGKLSYQSLAFTDPASNVTRFAISANKHLDLIATGNEVKVTGTFKTNTLTYPTSDGSANQVIVTDGSGNLSFANNSAFNNTLTADLNVDDNNIVNNGSDSSFFIGKNALPTGTQQTTARLNGPVIIGEKLDHGTDTNRAYMNTRTALVKLTADCTSNDTNRIRLNIDEAIVDGNGFDTSQNTSSRGVWGKHNDLTIENRGSSSSDIVRVDGNKNVVIEGTLTNGVNVTDMSITSSIHFIPNIPVTNLYGFKYEKLGSPSITNHFSFHSDVSGAKLKNTGPAELSGIAYPTSDGSNGQVLVTNGSGTLSFADNAGSFSGDLNGNNLRDSNDGTVNIREATNAADLLQIYDGSGNGGTDSTGRIDLQAVGTNATGNSIRSMERGTANYAPFFFQGKLLDFFAIGDKVRFDSATVSGSTPEITFRTDSVSKMTVFADKIEMLQPTKLVNYTIAQLPTGLGATGTGAVAYVTNESSVTSGKCVVFWDGTNWKLMHSPNTTAS